MEQKVVKHYVGKKGAETHGIEGTEVKLACEGLLLKPYRVECQEQAGGEQAEELRISIEDAPPKMIQRLQSTCC